MSGGGKGTIVKALRDRRPELWFSVSATTREPRPGEVDGRDYRFVSDAQFDEMIDRGRLVEWVSIYGHRSGTPKDPIDVAIAAGRDVLLELEVNGAEFVKRVYPDSKVVFLTAPDIETQRRRLQGRGTTGADLERRLSEAADEAARASAFDAMVVNDKLAETIEAVDGILFGYGA